MLKEITSMVRNTQVKNSIIDRSGFYPTGFRNPMCSYKSVGTSA